MLFMLMYIWFRATFPRFRFDQLMDLGWKWMIPLALANIAVTADLRAPRPAVQFPGRGRPLDRRSGDHRVHVCSCCSGRAQR